jgi:hypothetical protein
VPSPGRSKATSYIEVCTGRQRHGDTAPGQEPRATGAAELLRGAGGGLAVAEEPP